ncbi:hypothetical protein GGI09_001426 [Coemansia sp. S100]|nr:hypothetical protein LPJ71_000031 [Coemansia sp. S17]KAJ2102035.1 hypothetical protein GGI09_001426 [Coemansia sp. S100]
MLFRSIVALVASAAVASALDPLPTNIGYLLNYVALYINSHYRPQIIDAAQLLESGYGLPNQQVQDEKIVSSLLSALSSQNEPSRATANAGVIPPLLALAGIPIEEDSVMASVMSELKNPAVKTQIADIVEEMIEFVAYMDTKSLHMFGSRTNGPTPTSSSTKTHPIFENTLNLRSSSTSPRSSATSTTDQSSDESSSSYESSSSKTNAAQSMKSLLGYLSMGMAAGVVASFF